jgi:sugar lactone lactonase YvrE
MTIENLGPPRVLCDGFHLPECPRWRNGRLYFSDMYGQAVFAVAADGAVERVCVVEGRPGGLGFAANGDLLVNEMERARLLRVDGGGAVSVHADLSGLVPSINDMVSSADGRCYVGRLTMEPPFDPVPLIAVDPQGRASIATKEKLAVANGMLMRPDGRTLIVAESVACRLVAYDVDAGGGLSNMRVFADLPEGNNPDGIGGDDAGGVWIASPHAGRFLRVVEGGELTHEVQLEPGRFAYACAVGGGARPTLFMCTSGHYDPVTVTQATAGRIETVVAPFASTGGCP